MFTKVFFESPDSIKAGKDLQGILHVEAKRDIQALRLDISFQGQEALQVYHRVGERVRTYRDHETILRVPIQATEMDATIRHHDDTLPKGSYQVPFAISIPSKLPSSCDFGDCNDSAKVEYVLQAALTGSGFVEDYHARQVVQILAKPRPVKTIPYHVPPQCDVILGGHFFVRGLVAAGAEVDDTVLIPGQQMKLDIAVVNDSLASVHKIRAELREKAEWTVNGHVRSSTHTILEESWAASGEEMKGKGKSPVSRNPFKKMPEGFDHNKYFDEVDEHLKNHDEHFLSLTLPPLPQEANNTYIGTYMNVSHELTVFLVTNMVTTDPEFKIPVRVARGYYQ